MRKIFVLSIAAIVCLSFISCSEPTSTPTGAGLGSKSSGASGDTEGRKTASGDRSGQAESTLQEAVKARTEVTVLADKIPELDSEVRSAMQKVLAKADGLQMEGNIFLTKDGYSDAVESFEKAAGLYRQVLDGKKVLKQLSEARQKSARTRALVPDAPSSAEKERIAAAERLEINAEGYVEAGEFEAAVAEFDKAKDAYQALTASGVPATLEEAVAARTAMLAARKQLRGLPKIEGSREGAVESLLSRSRGEDGERAKRGTLPDVLKRGSAAESAAAQALEERDYAPARALFAQAESLYREGAVLQTKRDQVDAARKTAEDSMSLADKAFISEARPASFERGRQALTDGVKAMGEENLDEAKVQFAKGVEEFAKAQTEAQAANELAKAQEDWAAARAAVDESLLAKHASGEADAARQKAVQADAKAAAGNADQAKVLYREAAAGLVSAASKALTLENLAKAAPVIARLESAVAAKDKFLAEDVLAELEKMIPSDAQMAGLRAKVAAVPGFKKKETVDLGNGVKIELVLIRPGSFSMGSDKGDNSEKPVHKVTISKPFYIGAHEVTQAQWEAVMGSNPSNFKGPGNPVENASWNDCQEFIRKLNERVPGSGFRLPTEAEWEYVCRAGSTTEYCYGDGEGGLGEYAWYDANSGSMTHPVGQKKPNAWGVYDMHGNVYEWCQDWYQDSYTVAPSDGSAWESPAGSYRVLRGGSWYTSPWFCRSALRGGYNPGLRGGIYGFRLVGVVSGR